MLTVVMPSFHSSSLVEDRILEIGEDIPIIIIENSKDIKFKRETEKKFKNVNIIIPDENLGWGKAINLGIKRSSTDFVFITQPDVMLIDRCIEKLIECIKKSTENNWQIVQDVAWKDYMIVPKYTMAGYTVMMKEIVDQIEKDEISHIILQAGVGGMAGAMMAGIARYLDNVPITMTVEPDSAACVLESIRIGTIKKIDIKRESLMGGMSCGEVSLVPWEILKNSIKYCVSLPDDNIGHAMKFLRNGNFSENKIRYIFSDSILSSAVYKSFFLLI